MWMMEALAFFAPSPNPYITMPQATAQYGHVLRVSVVRRSLNSRTSATAAVGENPMSARLDPASVAPVILRNWRRLTSVMRTSCFAAGIDCARVYSARGDAHKTKRRAGAAQQQDCSSPALYRQEYAPHVSMRPDARSDFRACFCSWCGDDRGHCNRRNGHLHPRADAERCIRVCQSLRTGSLCTATDIVDRSRCRVGRPRLYHYPRRAVPRAF